MIVLKLSSQSYQFDSIPDNLKRGADAVIRSHQYLFTLIKPGNAVRREKMVITLLNENAADFTTVNVTYDKFSKVNYLRGVIYDEKGEIIKTLGILDIIDRSAVMGGTFYSDDRVQSLSFPEHKYPYTIEYEYEKELSSLINYPEFAFQQSPDVSVERAGIQLIIPRNMTFRYLTDRLKSPVDSVVQKDVTIYTWQEENIPARSRRQYTYKEIQRPPALYTAPLDFEYGGYKGSMNSWKSFGDWTYNLIKDRGILSEEQKRKVADIVSKAKDDREKVKLIYEYMQSSTRYVLIYIGIGGFQPAEASAVDRNGFGDCKALVNYTKSLLSAAGINSIYTLVMSGSGEENQIKKDFVINHFNHVILCVPMQKDTVWLECTNQRMPFNYIAQTDDRYALLVTPEGGRLVKTPAFGKADNVFRRTGSVSLNNFGKSSARLADYYSGVDFFSASGQFGMASEEELKRDLDASLRFPDINIASVKFSENKSEKPSAVFSYEASINDFAKLSGRLMTFNPSIDNEEYLQEMPMDLKVPYSRTSYDSIAYNLPIGYKVEFRPADVNLESEFGKFSYQLDAKTDKIIYRRYFEINKGYIPVEKFEAFRSFINQVAKADRAKIILSN